MQQFGGSIAQNSPILQDSPKTPGSQNPQHALFWDSTFEPAYPHWTEEYQQDAQGDMEVQQAGFVCLQVVLCETCLPGYVWLD